MTSQRCQSFSSISIYRILPLALIAACLAPAAGLAAEPSLASGIDRSGFDTSVRPGDNFFQYVNGNWVKENPIPAEYSRWGAFPKLRDDNLIAQREILDELAKKSAGSLDEDSRKLRDFYATAMD